MFFLCLFVEELGSPAMAVTGCFVIPRHTLLRRKDNHLTFTLSPARFSLRGILKLNSTGVPCDVVAGDYLTST